MGNINAAAWYRKQMCNSLIKVILDLDLQVWINTVSFMYNKERTPPYVNKP